MPVSWRTRENTSATKSRVCVGLSGGVDSALSAALLKKAGHDVVGVFIRIALPGYPCAAGEDKVWAQRAAAHLKIPFVEVDLSQEYRARVFELSMREFSEGRTPNPDALCNREIKFGLFFDWCMAQGADRVATGHYAQTKDGLLYVGADEEKDQSYFLTLVPQEKLKRTLFPVGHLRKSRVRALAKSLGLPNAARPDSQGLCFLGNVSMADMLARELALVPGDVLGESGEVVGRHRGAPFYTMGQRHGFELFASKSHTLPHYVIAKNLKSNTITVSSERFPRGAKETIVELKDINWIGDAPGGPCMARYRYRGALIPASLKDGRVALREPHYIPEGQTLALYEGARCAGGGIIAGAWPSSSPSPTGRRNRLTNASSSRPSSVPAPKGASPRG